VSKSQLLPWPFVLCRAVRSHAEKPQAACEGSVSLCVTIKLPTAKSSEVSVVLDLFRTPGGNFLRSGEWCFISVSVFLYF